MQIVVSANGPDLDASISPVFGRCAMFLFVDSETLACREVPNPAISAPGGAGVQAAQYIVDQGAEALISGNVGPNAFAVFRAAGLPVYAHTEGTIRQAVEALAEGRLTPVEGATGPSHVGTARGGGGRGRAR
jgi:predicted Fe-Mo cluster-binding NifX family protein